MRSETSTPGVRSEISALGAKKYILFLLPFFLIACTTETAVPQVSKSIESAVF